LPSFLLRLFLSFIHSLFVRFISLPTHRFQSFFFLIACAVCRLHAHE
jgi:hypothetical protein